MAKLEGSCVTFFRPIVLGLTAMGLEWKSLLESCGIDPELISDSEARVPLEVFDRFWLLAAEQTNDPCFGLHLGEHLRPLAVNIAGYLLISSATVREGLERVIPYQRLVFGRDFFSLIDRGAYAFIRWAPLKRDPLDERAQTEYKAMIILKLLDWITEIDFQASEVRFRHAPAGPPSEYERILRCPVKFQSEQSEVVVSQHALDQPSLHSNPEIAEIHETYAERHLAELEDESVARKVETLLMSTLDRGPCAVAKRRRRP